MSRKSHAVLVASHLLVLSAGGFIAWQSADRDAGGPETVGTKEKAARPSATVHRAAKAWTGSEYARAWKALREGIYTTRERVRIQRDLLARWAEVDLAAAIEAALGEAWDSDGMAESDPSGPLLDVFSEVLASNPQQGWDMIRGRQFGVGTGMLRRVWMEAVGRSDPLFLANRVAELSWRDRPVAIGICHAAVQAGAGGVTEGELFGVFSELPPEMVSAEQLMEFTSLPAGEVDLTTMKQEVVRLGDDDRMVRVKANLLGRALAGNPAEAIAGEIEDLPQAAREEIVWAVFRDSDKPENVLGLADLLVDEEAWGKLEQRETVQQLQKVARTGAAREVAEWAMTLPVRKETMDLFQHAVEPFLAGNLEASGRWLNELPDGVWRDLAYAGFSQAALDVHNNSRASRWALNRIGDQDFKSEAEDWRSQWEKRTGWTKK